MFRPMLRQKEQLPQEECLAILRQTQRGVLSVLGDDGYPYGTPLNHFYCDDDGKIYFHGGKTGHRLDAVRRCDKASFCVIDRGWHAEGEWAMHFRSVIVFGRLTVIEDRATVYDISRRLSYKFTQDDAYIDDEIRRAGARTLLLCLAPEHMTGKQVLEA